MKEAFKMEDVADYMSIKDDATYSLDEFIAGFCYADIKYLPHVFTEQLLEMLSGDERSVFRSKALDRIGEERYKERLDKVFEDAVRVLSNAIECQIEKEEHITRISIYTNKHMHQLKVAMMLNLPFEEYREKRNELGLIFQELMKTLISSDEGKVIGKGMVNIIKHNGWDIG